MKITKQKPQKPYLDFIRKDLDIDYGRGRQIDFVSPIFKGQLNEIWPSLRNRSYVTIEIFDVPCG